jgi:hypothetical protein
VLSDSTRTSVALKGIAHTSRLGLNSSPGAHPGPYQFVPYLQVGSLPAVAVHHQYMTAMLPTVINKATVHEDADLIQERLQQLSTWHAGR